MYFSVQGCFYRHNIKIETFLGTFELCKNTIGVVKIWLCSTSVRKGVPEQFSVMGTHFTAHKYRQQFIRFTNYLQNTRISQSSFKQPYFQTGLHDVGVTSQSYCVGAQLKWWLIPGTSPLIPKYYYHLCMQISEDVLCPKIL